MRERFVPLFTIYLHPLRLCHHISLVTEPQLVNVGQINLSITLKCIVLPSILFILLQIPSQLFPFLAPPGFRQKNILYRPSFRKLAYQIRAPPFLEYANFKFLQRNKLISALKTVVHVTVCQNNFKWQWNNVCRSSSKKYKSLPLSESTPVCMKLIIARFGTLHYYRIHSHENQFTEDNGCLGGPCLWKLCSFTHVLTQE